MSMERSEQAAMYTVLLAEDENPVRDLVRTTLADPEYRILEARDGAEALALVRAEAPDLIVADWMMPQLTGIGLAELLRREADASGTAPCPFILLTALQRPQDVERGRQAGVAHYLVKPFSPLELMDRVREILT